MPSFSQNLNYSDERIVTELILETPFSKEIRILLRAGQTMKEHQASHPIILHLLSGQIDVGVESQVQPLSEGDIITLDSHVMHDLHATQDAVVRLSLSKPDSVARVQNVTSK